MANFVRKGDTFMKKTGNRMKKGTLPPEKKG
jgi:hypothetical protein